MKLHEMVFVAGTLLAGSMAAFAADGTSTGNPAQPGRAGTIASRTAAPATPAGKTSAEDKVASEFTVFAGSQGNARSLVTGLRQGGEITLAPQPYGPAGVGVAFTPPTPPMDSGNVRIALALAQEQLIRLGITRPAPEQIKAALVGGTVTSGQASTTTRLQGVLQMRAQGTGWSQIANAMGTKLGHVMGGLQQTNQQIAAGRPVPGAGAAVSTGIVTAAGRPAATGARFQAGGENAFATGQVNGSAHAKP